MKTCTKCGVSKQLFEFSKHKSYKDGLQYHCKVCANAYSKLWQQSNLDKAAVNSKRWYQNNFEKAIAKNKRWAEKNSQKRLKYAKTWRQAHPDKINAFEAKRRASKLQATPPWLSSGHQTEMALCYEEAFALKLYTGQDYHVDHIVPLQGKNVCGLHVPWNLQVILARDNLSKGNKHVDA